MNIAKKNPDTKERLKRNNTGKKSVNSIYNEKQASIFEAITNKNDGIIYWFKI